MLIFVLAIPVSTACDFREMILHHERGENIRAICDQSLFGPKICASRSPPLWTKRETSSSLRCWKNDWSLALVNNPDVESDTHTYVSIRWPWKFFMKYSRLIMVGYSCHSSEILPMTGFSLTERARLLIRTHSLKSVYAWLGTMHVLNPRPFRTSRARSLIPHYQLLI